MYHVRVTCQHASEGFELERWQDRGSSCDEQVGGFVDVLTCSHIPRSSIHFGWPAHTAKSEGAPPEKFRMSPALRKAYPPNRASSESAPMEPPLQTDEGGIDAVSCNEFGVRALLDYLSALNDDDEVGHANC